METTLPDYVDMDNAIVITTEDVTGDTIYYPYKIAVRATVAAVRTSMHLLNRTDFCDQWKSACLQKIILNQLHTVTEAHMALGRRTSEQEPKLYQKINNKIN